MRCAISIIRMIAAGAAAIAKFLFVVFLILCVLFLVLGFVVTKKMVD
jgi:uncharacterized membrane protein YtjA (UPF0391 family)